MKTIPEQKKNLKVSMKLLSLTLRHPFCTLFRMLRFQVARSFFHNMQEMNSFLYSGSDITIFYFIQAYEIFSVLEK